MSFFAAFSGASNNEETNMDFKRKPHYKDPPLAASILCNCHNLINCNSILFVLKSSRIAFIFCCHNHVILAIFKKELKGLSPLYVLMWLFIINIILTCARTSIKTVPPGMVNNYSILVNCSCAPDIKHLRMVFG